MAAAAAAAAACIRSINRPSPIRSFVAKARSAAPPPSVPRGTAASAAPSRRFPSFISRSPVELGCCSSMYPLHSAVAAARMTSRLSSASPNCRALTQGTLCHTSPGL